MSAAAALAAVGELAASPDGLVLIGLPGGRRRRRRRPRSMVGRASNAWPNGARKRSLPPLPALRLTDVRDRSRAELLAAAEAVFAGRLRAAPLRLRRPRAGRGRRDQRGVLDDHRAGPRSRRIVRPPTVVVALAPLHVDHPLAHVDEGAQPAGRNGPRHACDRDATGRRSRDRPKTMVRCGADGVVLDARRAGPTWQAARTSRRCGPAARETSASCRRCRARRPRDGRRPRSPGPRGS